MMISRSPANSCATFAAQAQDRRSRHAFPIRFSSMRRWKRSSPRPAAPGRADFLPASRLATALLGDSIATNPFLLGYRLPKGAAAACGASILAGDRKSGVAVEQNRRAFHWGRRAAHDFAATAKAAGLETKPKRRAARRAAAARHDRRLGDGIARLSERGFRALSRARSREIARPSARIDPASQRT